MQTANVIFNVLRGFVVSLMIDDEALFSAEEGVNVIDVKLISHDPYVSRDLALIKVRTDDVASRNAVTTICERYPGRIIDIGTQVAIIEIAAQEDVVEAMIEELKPVGIVELVRTGVVAMGRGTRIHDTQYEPVMPSSTNGNGYHI